MTSDQSSSQKKRRGSTPERLTAKQIGTILKGTLADLPRSDIAEMAGVSDYFVAKAQTQIAPLLKLAEHAGEIAPRKAEMLEAGYAVVISRLAHLVMDGEGDIRDLVAAADVLHKHLRLEQGKSTANISAVVRGADALDPPPSPQHPPSDAE